MNPLVEKGVRENIDNEVSKALRPTAATRCDIYGLDVALILRERIHGIPPDLVAVVDDDGSKGNDPYDDGPQNHGGIVEGREGRKEGGSEAHGVPFKVTLHGKGV